MFAFIKSKIKERYWPALMELQYGRDVIVSFAEKYASEHGNGMINILDVGLGQAIDILNIKNILEARNKSYRLYGLEYYEPNIINAEKNGIKVYSFDLEKDMMPFEDGSMDIIVMNQVLEHTKEWYFIFKEVNRVLKQSGICIIGVPNLVSWHERVRLLFGKHPNCLDLKGPHVRGVVMKNFIEFIEQNNLFKSSEIYGRYFYGILNYRANLFASKVFSSLCVSNFLYITKLKSGDFSKILDEHFLETNFYRG